MSVLTTFMRDKLMNVPIEDKVTLIAQGSLLEFKVKEPLPIIPPQNGRGCVTVFSPSARLRMFKFINRMDWKKSLPAVFVTLTYPDNFIGRTFKQRNQDRYLFWRWAENRIGKRIPYLWRCEWMPRQTGMHVGVHFAHLHMLFLGARFLDKDEVNETWKRVIHHNDTVITWIDGIWDGRKAGIYLAKYIAKKEPHCVLDIAAYLNKGGRNWGTVRKAEIPLRPKQEFTDLTKEQIDWLRAEGNAALPWLDKRHRGSFTVMGTVAETILKDFEKLCLTGPGEGL